jgi:hypothetical protein
LQVDSARFQLVPELARGPQHGHPVLPVPDESTWLMMAANRKTGNTQTLRSELNYQPQINTQGTRHCAQKQPAT